jgi:hypothetical protein
MLGMLHVNNVLHVTFLVAQKLTSDMLINLHLIDLLNMSSIIIILFFTSNYYTLNFKCVIITQL